MVPYVSPDTVIGLDAPVAVIFPGEDVTVYDMMGLPPFEAGAKKLTVACALPAVAITFVGAPGTVARLVVLSNMETVLLAAFDTARSSFPSPLKSPVASDKGLLPTL